MISREKGLRPSQEYRNMKSDLLSLVLPDDIVGKIIRPSHFVLLNTSGRVDSLDSEYGRGSLGE